jgi:hypothetical protein
VHVYGFQPTLRDAPAFKEISKPFWKLIINARKYPIYAELKDWNRSVSCNEITYDYCTFVGLSSSNGNATAVLSATLDFDTKGYYLVMLRRRVHPDDNGEIKLFIDDNEIKIPGVDEPKIYSHPETIRFPIKYYSAGSHDFEIEVNKQSYVHELFVYPITRWVAGSDKSLIEKHTKRFEVNNIDFTENGVTENNILTAKIPLQDRLYNTNNESIIFTDYKDPITLILGHDYKNAMPKFGGFALAPTVSNDIINLKCMGRDLDMINQDLDHNFCIGNPENEDYVEYGSVYELARYLASTLEYPIITQEITEDYGFHIDFRDITAFNNITIANLTKTRDTSKELATLLKPVTTGNFEAVLWSSATTWNAAVYETLFFPYTFSGITNPLPVNIAVDMYKTGQSIANAVRYYIRFSGGVPGSNNLGSVTPDYLNSGWPGFRFNLKTAFDTIAASTEYHISRIALNGTVSSNPTTYGIWLPKVMSYKEIFNAPKFSNNSSKNVYQAYKKLCEDTNHIAYIQPGIDRSEDKIIILPESSISSIVTVDEKRNLRDISKWEYDPQGQGLCNQRTGIFTIDNSQNAAKSYSSYQDIESIKKYERVKTRETLNGINNQVDADKSVQDYVTENKIKKVGVEVAVDGNVMYSPVHYVATELNNNRLSGEYPIKGISQKLDIVNGNYESVLGINRVPGSKLRRQNRTLMRFYRNNYSPIY